MDGHAVSPLDLSGTLPVGGGLSVPYPLSGSPVTKTNHADGYYGAWPGWVVSISVLPFQSWYRFLQTVSLRTAF